MTAAQLIASLPRDRVLALNQLDGALRWGEWTPEERQTLVLARAELMRGRK